jgi:hypothetical protein
MDNKINEIRRKISVLRAEMLKAEDSIRDQINGDMDCTETSLRLMEMRREMVSLIRERDALGGWEKCPNIAERLKENYRTPPPRVLGKRISSQKQRNKTVSPEHRHDVQPTAKRTGRGRA